MRNLSFAILCSVFLILYSVQSVMATDKVIIVVESIKASQKTSQIDPKLKGLVKDLGPVLNYSSFHLIEKNNVELNQQNVKRSIIIPGKQLLEITFLGFVNDYEVKVLFKIMKKGEELFRTTLLMANNGSAIIGGSKLDDGVLLLRIQAKFDKF